MFGLSIAKNHFRVTYAAGVRKRNLLAWEIILTVRDARWAAKIKKKGRNGEP